MKQYSRGMICPSSAKLSPSKPRGRRECRMLVAPAALRASEKSTQASHHRYAETVRHSLRDGLRLIRALPGVPGLIAPVASPETSAKLDTSVGVSGPRVFARPPAASLALRRGSVHRSLPQRTWRLAVTPLLVGQDEVQHTRILISVKANF